MDVSDRTPSEGNAEAKQGRGENDKLARLFFVGTFSFPFRAKTLVSSLPLSIGAMFAVGLPAATLLTADGFAIVFLVLMALTGFSVLFALWLVAASACGMTILLATADGTDTIEEWPYFTITEWVGDLLYLVSGFLFSLIPGLPLGLLLGLLGVPTSLGTVLGATAFFPVALLSMLENNSPINPLSRPIWRSVLLARQAWGVFYLLTFAGAAVAVFLSLAALHFGGRMIGMTVTGIVVAAAWMIYFRLLGRLAWYCADRMAREEPEVELEEKIEDV